MEQVGRGPWQIAKHMAALTGARSLHVAVAATWECGSALL